MKRIPYLAVLLPLATACGDDNQSRSYSTSEVKKAFGAEGLPLHAVGAELRSDRGFWIVIFGSRNEAEERADRFYPNAALGQPQPIHSLENVVVYTTERLERPIQERVKRALAELPAASGEP